MIIRNKTIKQAVKQTLACLEILTWGAAPARADVPWASDLQQDAAAARAANGVVLVVFVASHCPYCETALNDFLIPMSGNANYLAVVMRRVESGGTHPLMDFQGHKLTGRQLAAAYGVRLTPTVMVFDGEGHPLTKPVIGVSTPDYYGTFLDQAIDQGVQQVRARIGGRPHIAPDKPPGSK